MIDLLYFQTESSNKSIIVPEEARNEVFKDLHSRTLSGHLGNKKTMEKIKERFVLLNMKKNIKEFISSCDVSSIVLNTSVHLISIDVAGPLETTKAGNRIIAVDNFSKYIEAIASHDFNAETTANFIINKKACKYKAMKSIYSDQGVNFERELVKKVCKCLKIGKIKVFQSKRNNKKNNNN